MIQRPSRRHILSGAALTLLASSAARAGAGSTDEAAQTGVSSGGGDGLPLLEPAWRDATPRSISGKLQDVVSVLDFIPAAEHAAIRERSSTRDVARYLQAAVDHIAAAGGGELFVPAGRYVCGGPVTLCKNLHLRGAGKAAAHIQFTHRGSGVPDGSGLRLIQPSNSSTAAYTKLSDLNVEMLDRSNRGACFYDNCSTFVTLRDCIFAGGRYGVVFDQTEVSGIYSCDLSGQLAGGAGLWIVNGPDITPANQGGFTNQITVDHNCQFNHGPAYAVVDDGGESHYFGNNNVNGGGMRFAGCSNLTIMGGEYESVAGRPTMTFAATTLAGNPVGGCAVVMMNGIITQPSGQPCIHIASLRLLNITRMQLTASGQGVAGHITGAGNCGYIVARQNANSNNPELPVFDGYANGGHDEDGLVPIFTNNSTGFTLPIAYYNAMVQTVASSPVTVTVPANSSLPFPVGTQLTIEQFGAGPVSLRAARGVQLDGTLATTARHQVLALLKTAPDRWLATRKA